MLRKQFLTFVLICCLTFTMLTSIDRSSGWGGGTVGHTHERMAHDSLEGLGGFTEAEIMSIAQYANEVDSLFPHPDKSCHRVRKYQDLFESYGGEECLFPGAESSALTYISIARRFYAAGNTAEGEKNLGYAIHYIQDAFCPPHIFPFSERPLDPMQPLTPSPSFLFESAVELSYDHSIDWSTKVTDASKITITKPIDLQSEIVEKADWIYNNIPCSYVRQDGQHIGDPGLKGWSMSDGDIAYCMEAASSLVKGAAEYARFGSLVKLAELAVTPSHWDNMQSVLDKMGYEYTNIQTSTLADLTSMKKYDAIFINCAPVVDPQNTFDPIREFVKEGGAIYASDYAYEYIEGAFPDFARFGGHIAPTQTVIGTIIDTGLETYVGSDTMDIVYNLDSWVPVIYISENVTVYVTNTVYYNGEEHPNVPVVIGYKYEKGYVVYTSFHHAAQDERARKLMEYLVLTPSTTDLRNQLEGALDKRGYSPSATFTDVFETEETKSYNYVVETRKDLTFAVNWYGSEMRLSIFLPNGTIHYNESSSVPPLLVEVPNAEPGLWSFSVKAIEIPYSTYPVVSIVGSSGLNHIFDLNDDGKIDISDISAWGLAFGSYLGHPRWNQRADINSDGRVDIVDAMLIARELIS